MSTRYKKLNSLKENLYMQGSPVIIMAGALLLDTTNEKVLAQCKFKNISSNTIKSISISIEPLDTANRLISDPIHFQYLDLKINRDEEFGSKIPIYLPDNKTRNFLITVNEVIFTDNTIWHSDDNFIWESIPSQNDLYPNNAELLKQYKLDINPKGTREILKYKDLWLCACEGINHNSENSCHACHFPLRKMESASADVLEEAIISRKEKEELEKKNIEYNQAITLISENKIQSYEEAISILENLKEFKDSEEKIKNCKEKISILEERKEQSVKKIKKKTICITSTIIVLALVYSLATGIIIPKTNYDKAINAMNSKDYDTAVELLSDLGDYKDSKAKLKEAKYKRTTIKSYKIAIKRFKEKRYTAVINLLKDNYKYKSSLYYKDSLYYLISSYYYTYDYDKVLELKSSYKGNKLDEIFEKSSLKVKESEYSQNKASLKSYLESGNAKSAKATLEKCDESTQSIFKSVVDNIGSYKGDLGTIQITCSVNSDDTYSYNITLKASKSSVDDQTFNDFSDCNEMLICDYGSNVPLFFKQGGTYNLYRARFDYQCTVKKNGDNLDLIINKKCISVESGAPYSTGEIFEETQQYIHSNY